VKNYFIFARVTFQSFKVIQGNALERLKLDFVTNRKRVCDFLLVRNSNLGHILHRFGDMAVFMCS